MPYYVRKISRSKWEKGSSLDPDADAITGCTRTTYNSLSLWQIDNNTANEIDKAILAFASSMERPEAFEIIVIEEEKINRVLTIENSQMNSPYKAMNSKHFDIIGIKYTTLKVVADVILAEIAEGKTIKITKGQIVELLKLACSDGRIIKEEVNEKLRLHF